MLVLVAPRDIPGIGQAHVDARVLASLLFEVNATAPAVLGAAADS